MDKKLINIFFAIIAILLGYFVWDFVSFTSKTTPHKPCEQYNLSHYANSCEDLLITHEATGIITNRYIKQDKFYTTEINSNLYKSTTPEQRLLIICSTKEIAKQKGLKPLVIDEKGIDY